MKRASYRAAIRWIIENDDTEWLDDGTPPTSVTPSLVASLFGVEEGRVIADLRRALATPIRLTTPAPRGSLPLR